MGDGVVGNRVLFWPLVSMSCLLVVLTEIVVKRPVVILRTAFRDKIRASGCQHRVVCKEMGNLESPGEIS